MLSNGNHIFYTVTAAVADLHQKTQPSGIALDPDAPNIFDLLAAHGYFPYTEPVIGEFQRLGTIIRCKDEFGEEIDELTREVVDWSQAEIIDYFSRTAQQHMDEVARVRYYDGILSLCSYAGSTDHRYGPEGLAGVVFRDKVWDYCYSLMDAVTAGAAQVPTTAEFRAALPPMIWPDSMVTYFSDGVLTAEENTAGLVTEPTLWGRVKQFFGV